MEIVTTVTQQLVMVQAAASLSSDASQTLVMTQEAGSSIKCKTVTQHLLPFQQGRHYNKVTSVYQRLTLTQEYDHDGSTIQNPQAVEQEADLLQIASWSADRLRATTQTLTPQQYCFAYVITPHSDDEYNPRESSS